MAISSEVRGQLARKFEALRPHLNERQHRLVLATEARLLGHGGVRAVAQAAGVSETTVRNGIFELEEGRKPLPAGRVRRPGGGRKRVEDDDPAVLTALLGLVEPDERGDPQSPLRWTTKSLRHLAAELTRQGHGVSAPTVGRLLKTAGFSLQANVKTLEGAQHPDRDAQFRYINEQVKAHQADGEPVISVDTKKREQLGRLPMTGREWRPRGEPIEVEDHHFFFSGPDVEQAIPYGIYDITANTGWVNVGVDHDTSVFAVESIRRWWKARGRHDYPSASRLLITADAGGSNGYRYRVWKSELAALAAETGLVITVCHFPPGTSKWNKIEHRLFSHITLNWRGRPLTSHDVVVNTIASTQTSTGLRVEAVLDTGDYPTGVAISKERFAALPLERHATHGTWNYTLRPVMADDPATSQPVSEGDGPAQRRQAMLLRLADPRLTGMSTPQLRQLATALAPAQAARTQERHSRQRGGRARRATGNLRAKPLFDAAARLLLTLLYQRQVCSMKVLADLLEVTDVCIADLVKETRRVLEDHGHHAGAAQVRFAKPAALLGFLDTGQRPARAVIIDQLSHPVLTGISRDELRLLIQRLAAAQVAQGERLGYQRRGGHRQPGTRSGVFPQKISNSERVVLTILYQRKLCTMDVLADVLGDVSRSSIGNVIRETRPLLQQAGHIPPDAPIRYRTAANLLAAVPNDRDTPTS
ncbi:ISAzo13 family transposase [Microbispora sp. SCL1-1]|uniref:ISAzo13 family transposase n=1 Tax=Microbispora TaxID=2005 RepID=UPI00115B6549|nr:MULTISPECIES: ISAzo13 family transposase [unclassified Microbispora]NJP30276.1 ISAzo13 family transposase [Microbispora sp. CL1-1]TQS02092.1 ISAzo13 family transposase [Microbispora sp. SCL1-1]